MKYIVPLFVLMIAVGCRMNKDQAAEADLGASEPVTDLTITPSATPVAYQPVPVQPIAYEPPVSAPVSAAGRSYTVKKGDTFWRIAASEYGDGKQWQKIASANPNVTATSLKVGQTLVIP